MITRDMLNAPQICQLMISLPILTATTTSVNFQNSLEPKWSKEPVILPSLNQIARSYQSLEYTPETSPQSYS